MVMRAVINNLILVFFYKRKRCVKLQEVEIGFCLLKSVKWTLDSHKRLSLQIYAVPGIGVTCCQRELRSWRHLLLQELP